MTRRFFYAAALGALGAALSALTLFAAALPSPAKSDSEPYDWAAVPIGGGGAVPQIIPHPRVKDLLFFATDVGGAYRWNPGGAAWKSLATWIPLGQENLCGVEGFAVDPRDSSGQKLFMVVGTHASEGRGKGERVRSTDGGRTWQKARIGGDVWAAGNWEQWRNQHLTVDPANSRLVYHASREGLFRTTDAGETWERMESAPTGDLTTIQKAKAPAGVTLVAIDTAAGTVENPHRSRRVYVSAARQGFWCTDDGGVSWRKIGDREAAHVEIAPSGLLYARVEGAVLCWKPGAGGAWTDVSPIVAFAAKDTFRSLALDPFDERHLLVSNDAWGPGRIWATRNGGESWTELKQTWSYEEPWYRLRPDGGAGPFGAHISALVFDPHVKNRVYFGDWGHVWVTDDIGGARVSWRTRVAGHEEQVSTGALCPLPEGNGSPVFLLTGHADLGGIVHTSLTAWPHLSMPKIGAVTGFDYAGQNPRIIAATDTPHWGSVAPPRLVLSRDGGATWTTGSVLPGDEKGSGRVAVSADGSRIVLSGPRRSGTFFTDDGGAVWHRSAGLEGLAPGAIWSPYQPLAADKVAANVFYAVGPDGVLRRSDDGGATFAPAGGAVSVPKGASLFLAASPYSAGELYLSAGAGGLLLSKDGGAHLEPVPGIENAAFFGLGKGIAAGVPALYVLGTRTGQPEAGIFRSDDRGASWTKINPPGFEMGVARRVAGDLRVAGRVYVAAAGLGVWCGTPPVTAARTRTGKAPR